MLLNTPKQCEDNVNTLENGTSRKKIFSKKKKFFSHKWNFHKNVQKFLRTKKFIRPLLNIQKSSQFPKIQFLNTYWIFIGFFVKFDEKKNHFFCKRGVQKYPKVLKRGTKRGAIPFFEQTYIWAPSDINIISVHQIGKKL